jgi:hypothetical protein
MTWTARRRNAYRGAVATLALSVGLVVAATTAVAAPSTPTSTASQTPTAAVATRPASAPAAAAEAPRGGLNGIHCFTFTDCLATGYRLVGPPYGGLVLQWDGTKWTYQSVPYPVGSRDSSLGTITCRGTTTCLAEGHYGTNTSEPDSYFDHYRGGRWTLTHAGQPSGYEAGATSCPSTNKCLALAVRYKKAAHVEVWKGHNWAVGSALPANPGASEVQLQGLSCVTATDCTAVGSDLVTSSGARQVLVLRLRGTRWSTVATPAPRAAPAPQLNAVTCTASNACEAVGGRSIGSAGGPALIERWNGSTWSIAADPARGNSGRFELAGVACFTGSSCQAWGLGASGADFIHWNGHYWTTERQTAAVGQFAASDVSCGSSGRCIAVGQTAVGSHRLEAASYNGSTWSVLPIPLTNS